MKLEERKLYNQVLKAYLKDFDKYIGIKKTKKEIKIVSHTVKKGIKRKMSAIKKVVISLNILSLLFLFACGEDNITNNMGNPPVNNDSLVLSLDSISLYGLGTITNDTIFFNAFNTGDSVKMTFNAETNCTDTAYINVNCGNISEVVSNLELPNSFTFYGRYVNFGTSILLYMHSSSYRYLRVRNFKLFKVNPV